jgi:hypothetical protein
VGAAWDVLAAASREKADSYLDEQIIVARAQAEVLRLQAHELKDEARLRHWSLRMRHLSDILKVAFEVGLAFIVTAFAISLAPLSGMQARRTVSWSTVLPYHPHTRRPAFRVPSWPTT